MQPPDTSQLFLSSDCIERRFITVAPDASLLETVTLMGQVGHISSFIESETKPENPIRASCVLVVEQQQLVGLLTERDLVRIAAERRSLKETKVSEVMARELITCQEWEATETVKVIQRLQQHRIRHLPVLNEQNQPVGLLIAHHCSDTRQWQPEEVEFLENLTVQVANAIQQAMLLEQAQRANVELEARVAERTAQLQDANKSLQEELVHTQQAEAALREKEAILRSFYDSAPLMMGVVEVLDDDILHLSNNAATAQFFGTTSEAMQNQLASQMGASLEYIRTWISHYRESQLTGQPVRFEYQHNQEGTIKWLSATVCYIGGTDRESPRFSYVVEDISDRKQTEIALRQSEKRYRQIVETTAEGIWMLDADNKTSFANTRMAQMLGYTVEEMQGMPLFAFMKVEEQKLAQFYIERRNQGIQENHDFKFCCKDGSDLWAMLCTAPLFDEAGKYTGALAMVTDITARKVLEEELTQKQQMLDAFITSAPVGMTVLDSQLRFTFINEGLAEINGVSVAEHIGKTPWEIVPDLAPKQEQIFQQVFSTGEPILYVEITGETQKLPGVTRTWLVSYFPIRSITNQPIGIGIVVAEITERKRAEAALRESEEKFRQLAENIHQVFFMIAQTGQILYISPAYERIWGKSLASLYRNPHSWLNLVHPDDLARIRAAFNAQIQKGEEFNETYRIIRPDDNIRWIVARFFPISDSNGQFYRFAGIAEDITKRKQAEDALQQQLHKMVLLKQITDEIRQNLKTQHIFETAAIQIGQAFGVNRCLIHAYIAEPEPQLPLVAEYLSGNYKSINEIKIPVAGNHHAEAVLRQDKAITTPDVNTETLFQPVLHLCHQLQIKSMVSIRTSYQGETNGLMGLHQCDRIRKWTPDEIELLESVAAQVGIALAQAALLEEQTRRSEELTHKNFALEQAKREAETANRAKSEFLANMSHDTRIFPALIGKPLLGFPVVA
ncbi:hypothetical protein NUACC21_08990 [Scytonema sp. NUACC21]